MSKTTTMKSTVVKQHVSSSISSGISESGSSGDFALQPIHSYGALLGSSSDFEDVSKTVACHGENFELHLKVEAFKPEEIQVKVSENMVTIEGKSVQVKDENNFKTRSFCKKFSIPTGVNPETIACNLSKDGVLKITAPIDKQHAAQLMQQQQQQDSSSVVSSTGSQEISQSQTSTSSTQQQQSSTKVQKKSVMSKTSSQTESSSVSSSRRSSVTSDISTNSQVAYLKGLEDEYIYRPRMFDNAVEKLVKKETSSQVQEVKKFEITYDVKDYKPSEIEVKVTKDLVKIEGKQTSEFKSQSFSKEFTVPAGVNPETITCTLSSRGTLTISAPIDTSATTCAGSGDQETCEESVETSSRTMVKKQTVQQQQHHQQSIEQREHQSVHQQQSIEQREQQQQTVQQAIQQSTQKLIQELINVNPTVDLLNSAALESKTTHHEDISKQVRHLTQNEVTKFETSLELPDYKPEEIRIRVSQNMVIIEGKSVTQFTSKEFSKKFTIPQGVKPETISSTFNPNNGLLTISAPIQPQQSPQQSEHQIQQSTTTMTTQEQQRVQQQQQLQQQKVQVEEQSVKKTSTEKTSVVSSSDDQSKSTEIVPAPRKSPSDEILIRPTAGGKTTIITRKTTTTTTTTSSGTGEMPADEGDDQDDNITNDGKNFEMKLQVGDYTLEEVSIKVTKNLIKIEGNHKSEMKSRSFYKEFTIPAGVKPETIKSSLSPEGILTISAPVSPSSGKSSPIPDEPKSAKTRVETQTGGVNESTEQQQVSSVTSSKTTKISQISQQQESVEQSEDVSRRQNILKPFVTTEDDEGVITNTTIEDISRQIRQVDEGKKFEVNLDVPKDYKPEEIKIRVTRTMVIVEAKSVTELTRKEFVKKFSIPAGVTPNTITSYLSPNGVLTVTAPVQDTKDDHVNTKTTQIEQQQHEQQQHQHQLQEQVLSTKSTTVQQHEHQKVVELSKTSVADDTNTTEESVISPIVDTQNELVPDSRFEDVSKDVCNVDEDQFEMKLNASEFKREEITIKVSKTTVTIEATQKSTTTSSTTKKLFKKFTIPAGVKPENITSTLSSNGTLTITTTTTIRRRQESIRSLSTNTNNKSVQDDQSSVAKNVLQQQQNNQQQQQIQQRQTTNNKSTDSTTTSAKNTSTSSRLTIKTKIVTTETMKQMGYDFSKATVTTETCINEQTKQFEKKVVLDAYQPEEIDVKVSNEWVIIEGKQEMTEKTNFKGRSFTKMFSVLPGVRLEQMTCVLSEDLRLMTITAPVA